MTRREKVEALRRLAAGTPYQAERDAALAKAATLEALERTFGDQATDDDFHGFETFEEAMGTWMNQWLEREALARAVLHLDAVLWDDVHWVVPGHGPLLDKDGLFRLYAEGVAA